MASELEIREEEEPPQKEDCTAEEKLKQLDADRKALRKQMKNERTTRLEEAAKMRVFRDEKIEKIQKKLKKISAIIYDYNKLGKVAKIKVNIFNEISKVIIPIENVN